MPATDSPPAAAVLPPAVPGWAAARRPVTSDAEAAFRAGAALTSLDDCVRAAPAWAGAWRQRLALHCAAAAMPLAGRAEDAAALRDAWHLRPPGGDPGPAGNVLAAFRRLAARAPGLAAEDLRAAADLVGLGRPDTLAPLVDRFDAVARSGAPAPFAAAAILGATLELRPDAVLLGWWLADRMLARRLSWPTALPLALAGAAKAGLGMRGRGEGLERRVCLAVAEGAAEACRTARAIAGRAARLEAAVPKLRAKGAGEAIRLLLDDDAVPATLTTPRLTRWGARRLFERLDGLGAVRELTGRGSFRLYGL